jgi:hypothetical protein
LIDVTSDDIKNGKVNSCVLCPIALACTRAFGCDYFVTGLDAQPMCKIDGMRTCGLPRSARRFIQKFDLGHDVWPFRFYLENPRLAPSPFV